MKIRVYRVLLAKIKITLITITNIEKLRPNMLQYKKTGHTRDIILKPWAQVAKGNLLTPQQYELDRKKISIGKWGVKIRVFADLVSYKIFVVYQKNFQLYQVTFLDPLEVPDKKNFEKKYRLGLVDSNVSQLCWRQFPRIIFCFIFVKYFFSFISMYCKCFVQC